MKMGDGKGEIFSTLFTGPRTIVGYAQVAPEQGIDMGATGLTYIIDDTLADLQVGERVMVPLGRGNRPVAGFVVQINEQCSLSPNKIKAILKRDPAGICLPVNLVHLAQWMSSYYCCPIGMVFAAILPAAVKRGIGQVQQTLVSLNPVPPVPPTNIKLSKLQKAALAQMQALTEQGQTAIDPHDLARQAGAKSISPVTQLIAKGFLTSTTQTIIRAAIPLEGQEDQGESGSSAPEGDLRTRLGGEKNNDHSKTPSESSQEAKKDTSKTSGGGEEAEGKLPGVPGVPGVPGGGIELNEMQGAALEHLVNTLDAGFGVHLLHGVTGSGKTEVYLRMIEHVFKVQPGAGAIVLVPEIALTPQTVARFTARFDSVAVMHSALTASQRHEQWRRIEQGEAKVVIGARSAVFAPMPRLGILIVDEEHESSYKQDQLPRYHARDVAVKRAHQLGAVVVLGSATPSLESYYNATVRGSYHLLRLPQRVAGYQLPHVQIVDMIEERRHRKGIHLLSRRLEDLLNYVHREGGQAMLLLNRRGYANYVACPDHGCGWLQHCQHCDATMVYHKRSPAPGTPGSSPGSPGSPGSPSHPHRKTRASDGYIVCHHCGIEQLLAPLCPQCNKKITLFGLGTQRVEEEIARKFPQLRFARMDSDTMRARDDYRKTLDAFGRGELDLLIGTQMIAKGLDFPNVRLVGVISADTALNMPDFRATERTFGLIAQVAGRAGRSEKSGIVVVQTFSPDDPTIQLAAKHDYEQFAKQELELRQQVGLPPYSRMARIVVRDKDHEKCLALARKLALALAQGNAQLGDQVRLRGPMPCPIARVADYHRQQIELVAPDAATLQRLMVQLRNARVLTSDTHTAVDVDPVSLL